MAHNPHKPGTPAWQQWVNDQIEQHDDENQARDTQQELASHERAREAAEGDTK